MTILNFVTQDELDDLPEDPSVAFMTLVNHAQRRLSEQTQHLDPDERYRYKQRDEIRTTITGSSKLIWTITSLNSCSITAFERSVTR